MTGIVLRPKQRCFMIRSIIERGLIFAVASIAFFFIGYRYAMAEGLPSGWPWHGVTIVFPEGKPEDINLYKKKLGINVVRLQLQLRKYAFEKKVSPDKAWIDGMAWADHMLDAGAQNSVVIILNISEFPLDPNVPLNQTMEKFWNDTEQRDGLVTIADRLSLHFHTRGKELAAYDLMSEPVVIANDKSNAPKLWPMLLARIIHTIKKNDPQRWIVVTPGPWGMPEGYRTFSPLSERKIIYNAHMYLPHAFTHQGIRSFPVGPTYPGRVRFYYWDINALRNSLQSLRNFGQKYKVPVLIGEFSAVRWATGGEPYIKDLASIFNEYGWSWLYHSGNGWHGWNPDYSDHYPGRDGATNWRNDYIGDQSLRWQTLREIFGVDQKKLSTP